MARQVRLQGAQQMRHRLLLATLTGTPLRIDDIRVHDEAPGLRDFEASFLRLLEKISDGCGVEINETGKRISSCEIRIKASGGHDEEEEHAETQKCS